MANDENPWMGTTEACDYLGVRPRTLYRMIDAGEIPGYKMGRVIRLRRNDLDAFIENVRVRPGELRHLFPTRKAQAPVESIVDEP